MPDWHFRNIEIAAPIVAKGILKRQFFLFFPFPHRFYYKFQGKKKKAAHGFLAGSENSDFFGKKRAAHADPVGKFKPLKIHLLDMPAKLNRHPNR